MKKFAFYFILFTITASVLKGSEQIRSFEELLAALKNGKQIRAVIHYAKCILIVDGEEESAPDAIGGMQLNTFEYFARMSVRNEKAFISASETVLISHPFYGFVNNYGKLRIYEDGAVEIVVKYLDPKTYEIKMDETFKTTINNGTEDGAAYFYF